MGVATDKSLHGLTTAVNNISTSGMSDSTGQAINTTLGTLGKDTSLQDINTTLQSLVEVIRPSASTNISNYLTIASGLTVLRKKAYKYGNVVIIDLNIQGTLNDGTLIATMDSQFRPADGDLRSLGTMANTSNGTLINNACLWFFAGNGQLEYYGTSRTGLTTMHLVYMI